MPSDWRLLSSLELDLAGFSGAKQGSRRETENAAESTTAACKMMKNSDTVVSRDFR